MLPTRRTFRRAFAGFLLFAMLFTQFAAVAYACPAFAFDGGATHSSQHAATFGHMAGMPAGMPCSGGMQHGDDKPMASNPGLCQAHCEYDAQARGQTQTASVPPPAVWLPGYVIQLPSPATHVIALHVTQFLVRNHAPPPPLSILNCCFRT